MAEEQFRALLEQSLTGVYIVQDDRIVYANHALARLFGYDSAAALQGKVAIELVAPEERSRIISLQAQRQLLEDGALRYRFTGVQRNAQRVVLEVHGRYCLHQGRMAIIGSMSDQSEAQRIQEDLARQVEEKTELLRVREQELQTILDKLPAMISYYDPDLRHRFGNQAYCDWHGVAAGALRGMPLSQVLSPALHQQIQDHLQRIADGKTCIFEQALQHANGQDHWQAQIHLVPDMRAGGLCGLFCLFIDITPIKAAQRAMHESETRFRQLFEAAPVAIGLYHRDGPCMMVNQALADLVGSTRAELQAQNFRRLASWRDSALLACADLALETDQPRHCDVALVSSFGRSLELQCEFSLPEIQGEHYLMLLAKDITPFRQSERLMRQAMADELEKSTLNHKYRLVVENLMDGFLSTDRRGRILDANDVMAALCGYRREALLAMNLSQLHDDSAAQSEQSRLERIVACGSLRFECWMRRQNGAAWPGDISASYSPVEDKIYWFARDITQMKHAEAEVRRLAFFDSLTQLPNRQLLLDRLQQALENSKRSRLHGALLFIDLDNFKQLNDSQGHAMGDLLLTQVATRLLACVRAQDTVARLGGDEFVVMLIDLHPQAAQAMQQTQTIADSILLALNQPYRLGQIDYANTPSIGISLFNDQEISLEALLKQADLAMYQAKAGGRNSSCFHQPEAPDRGQIKTPAPDSPPPLNLEALDLHFAAQFDQQHRLVGCQAVLGERQPAQHASASPAWSAWPGSEAPASPHLMLNMLELACRQLAAWQHDARLAHTPLTLSLNADLFAQDDFVSRLHALLSRHPVPAQRLRLQLPESVLQSSPAQLSTSMTRLSQTGVGFSLSHFGTGPATLAHLESLPLSQLQIAPLYVRDLLHDHNAQAMVRAIVAMGHSLGLAVAADQVSSAEQWDHLRHEGCDLGQGPWFSAPLPAAAFQLAHGVLAQAETAPD
jgi:diguanylate cyclase (GGDEF)-like protein/PAS domain S-box-containing protein